MLSGLKIHSHLVPVGWEAPSVAEAHKSVGRLYEKYPPEEARQGNDSPDAMDGALNRYHWETDDRWPLINRPLLRFFHRTFHDWTWFDAGWLIEWIGNFEWFNSNLRMIQEIYLYRETLEWVNTEACLFEIFLIYISIKKFIRNYNDLQWKNRRKPRG